MSPIAVIIVTHDSERFLGPCLASLRRQTLVPAQIIVVDSGSADSAYLDRLTGAANELVLRHRDNIGFARANNAGWRSLDASIDLVLFLNPDVVLADDALARAANSLQEHPEAGVVSGRLLGYDFRAGQGTGLLDSTGIFRTWYGRWYDRGQGQRDAAQFARPENIPAACGAFLFCRRQVLEKAALAGGAVFDPAFFLYKEDIELCLRLRKQGWLIRYEPALTAWHGRGWRQRGEMSPLLRLAAARSELLLYRRHPSPYLLWAVGKYFLVRLFGV